MRVLVTGASGLLGLNLALEATKQHQVFGVVKDHALNTEAFTVLQADLLEPGSIERLIDQTQPDWVIHCAALAILDACEAQPELASQLNIEVPRKLASYVARGGARLLHVSTDAVFDGKRGDYTEADNPNPLSVYARTKLAGEQAVAEANTDALIARVNLFGWSLSGKRSLGEFFYYSLSAGRSVQGFTDVYFCPLLANHLASILLEMLAANLSGLYHVVSRECVSKYAFGIRIAHRFGMDESLIHPTSVEESGLKAARSPNLTLQTDKLQQALGHATPDVEAGIEGFYQQWEQGYPQRIMAMGESRG